MDAGLAGFLGVLVGGLITSIAKWIEQKSQWNIERRRLYIGKLEELHVRCHELRLNAGELCSDSEDISTSWDDFESASRRFNNSWNKVVREAGYIVSQSELYFPGLSEDTIMDIWTKMGILKRNEETFIFSRGKGEFAPRHDQLLNVFEAIEKVELEIVKKLRPAAGITE